jgi:hypothetical protein
MRNATLALDEKSSTSSPKENKAIDARLIGKFMELGSPQVHRHASRSSAEKFTVIARFKALKPRAQASSAAFASLPCLCKSQKGIEWT